MTTLLSKLRSLALVAAAGYIMAFSNVSGAAAFQVNFDPPDALWGSAIFNVQDSCLATDGNYDSFWELLALALDGCYITFGGASISVNGEFGDFTQYNTPIPFDLVIFTQLIVDNHQLAGITTLILLDPVGEAASAAAFGLQTASTGSHCHEALLFTAAGDVTFFGCYNGVAYTLPGDVHSIVRIPEPGTLALLFGAGIAGWWLRRRRDTAA